ncbi:MAG: hypothetical protein EOP48_31235 [Sphingobacteriales bacterium]|nr:MAG: hypothetical protein EOP48_31235 [Sphingobacteriales bacterium]
MASQRNYSPIKKACPELTRLVSYSPQLALALGNVNAALLLCQLVYLQEALGNTPQRNRTAPIGHFFARSARLMAETGLTYEQQVKARERLVELELISEKYDAGNRNLYISVNIPRIRILANYAVAHDIDRIDWGGQGTKRPMKISKKIIDESITENTLSEYSYPPDDTEF